MLHRLPVPLPLSVLLLLPALAAQEGGSTFGHARARELAELGRLPTARDIVVRDLVNYHRHRLPLPKAGEPVALDLRFDRAASAFGDEVWLQVGYTTASQGDRALAAPCAVALVVDTSGSMGDAGKMTAVHAGLRAFAERLRPDDQVALIGFDNEATVRERLRPRGDGEWLRAAIERLAPGGGTNLHAGLMLGLDELSRRTERNGSRRVVLLTDGIANQGVTDPARILTDAQRKAEAAIDIATIGVGQNLDVALLQRLAEGSRGLFHFVADGQDVAKVFVDEADALLCPVARSVSLRVTLPRSFEVLDVLHEGARFEDSTFDLALPDLNAGATGVVMVRCRQQRTGAEAARARAELTFAAAESRSRQRLEATAEIPVGERDAATPDVEVRKHAAIATLARGLAAMAGACDTQRWADAERALRAATDAAERLFPGADEDVQRVRDIAAGHQRTLRRYVDRFRDF